jgi:hypothetical protein
MMLFAITLLAMLRRKCSELLIISFRASRQCLKAFGEMCLFARCTIVELRHHIDIIVPLNRPTVSEFLFLNLNESRSRSLGEYFLIFILLLVHDCILIMNGVFIISILFLG